MRHSSSLKTIHVKLKKPEGNPLKTPTANICLTDRRILSPSSHSIQTQYSERKVVSIELKRQTSRESLNDKENKKKCLKVKKKKAESVDLKTKEKIENMKKSNVNAKGNQNKRNSVWNSQTNHESFNCFQDSFKYLEPQSNNTYKNWDSVIEDKKKELYSYLYKLDKQLLTFQHDFQPCFPSNNKQEMIDLVKRKLQKNSENIHTKNQPVNIYKINKFKN